ncbi:MAG: flippase-like domain-containing protein [Planctomycetes bacterium]|nr:flippase-like domain-containing protein [Planctomycetota bacterium]
MSTVGESSHGFVPPPFLKRLISSDRRSVGRRLVGSIIGLALLCSALLAVWLNRDDLGTALKSITVPSPALIAAALALPLLNWLLISWSLCILYRRAAHIAFSEMTTVVATAWLLNYLPMRPGLFGRFAYHRTVNHVPIRVSTMVLVQSVGLSMASAAGLLAVSALLFGQSVEFWFAAVLGVAALLTLLSIATRRSRPRVSVLFAAGVVRWFDMLVWAARYWVAFRLIGSPIDVLPAVLLATVSQVVLLVPFTGNGLGFREWAIGLVAGRFAIAAVSLGIIADLVNRIAELAVAIPAGLIAWSILSRRLARRSAHGPADADPSAPTQTE